MQPNYLLARAVATALAIGAFSASSGMAYAQDPPGSSQTAEFDIKPQSLASALSAFAVSTHQQILFTPETVRGRTTGGVSGVMTSEEALRRLLAGTGLSFSRSADGMILVSADSAKKVPASPGPSRPASPQSNSTSDAGTPTRTSQEQALEEVVVTATGHKQNIQDVPYNISAVSGEALQAAGITDFYELAKAVPGLAMSDTGPRGGLASNLVIRGISINAGGSPQFPDTTQPAVSTYIDSTPIFANLRITDLARVEVLRGPQGTLYGANSSGGTIRFIYNEPTFDAVSATVSGGAFATDGGAGLSYQSDLTLNLPVTDTVALRFSGGNERNGGFINANNQYVLNANGAPVPADPADLVNSPALRTRVEDTNWDRTTSARLTALWRPSDVWRAKLSYQYQRQDSGGPQLVSYPAHAVDSRQTNAQIPEPFSSTVNFAALETETQLGFATLTTSTSHFETKARAVNDFTGFYYSFPFYGAVYGNSPRFLAAGVDVNDSAGWVAEVRLASADTGDLKWVSGAFFQRRHTVTLNQQSVPGYSDFYGACIADATTTRACGSGTYYPEVPTFADGRVQNALDFSYLNNADQIFTDKALYAEVEWRIADRWRLTGGIRGYQQGTTNNEVGGLLFEGPNGVGGATLSESQRGALGKAGISYDIAPATMIYTLFSQGIRPAGINGLPGVTFDVTGAPTATPAALFTYKSDRINNFEVGVKGTFRDRLNYTLTWFDMRWNDVQLGTSVTQLQIGAVINAGDARSRGVEFELGGRLTDRLSASVGYTYVDAKLTSDNPPNGVDPTQFAVGERLPGVPDQLASASLQYVQPLAGDLTLSYSLAASYRGVTHSALILNQDARAGGFVLVDPAITLAGGPWSVRLYSRNALNKAGVYGYTASNWGAWSGAAITRPRTIGLSAQYTWR